MNEEKCLTEEKENLGTLKTVSLQYRFDKIKGLRAKEIGEKRAIFEQHHLFFSTGFHTQTINKLEEIMKEVNMIEKLRPNQNRDLKDFLSNIRKSSKSSPKEYAFIINSSNYYPVLIAIIKNMHFPSDLKYEALWNMAVSSSYKLNQDKARYFLSGLISFLPDIGILTFNNQLFFLQKILLSVTNIILDQPSLGKLVIDDPILQKSSLILLQDHEIQNISISLWFIRNILRSQKSGFLEIVSDFSLQNNIASILKKHFDNQFLVTEAIWTLAHVSQMTLNFNFIGRELCSYVIEIGCHYEDSLLLPSLTIVGNCFPNLDFDDIKKILNENRIVEFLQKGLLSVNFLKKREALFLISNMAITSEISSEFLLQKQDLIDYLTKIILNKEIHLLKEATTVIYNLMSISNGKYRTFLIDNFPDISKLKEFTEIQK